VHAWIDADFQAIFTAIAALELTRADFIASYIAGSHINVRFVPEADSQAAFGYHCWWTRVLAFVEHHP
jgi:hypothetical protein